MVKTKLNQDSKKLAAALNIRIAGFNRRVGDRISTLYLLLLSLGNFAIFSILYLVLPGHVGRYLSPIQPDSLTYICKGLKWSGLNSASITKMISGASNYFVKKGDPALACVTEPTFYHQRKFLSWLIAASTHFDLWPLIFLPSILIAVLSIIIWYKLTKSWVAEKGVVALVIALLPWLSPHVGWYVWLVMTEGPVIFSLLLIFYLLRLKLSNLSWVLLSFGAGLISLDTRQSWPLVGALFAYAFNERWLFKSKVTLLLNYLAGLFVAFLLTAVTVGNTSTTPLRGWHFGQAIKGTIIGISHDFIHYFKYADIFGLTLFFLSITYLLKAKRANQLFMNWVLIGYGLLTVAYTYENDGNKGENWRFFITFFFGIILLKINSVTSVFSPKAGAENKMNNETRKS